MTEEFVKQVIARVFNLDIGSRLTESISFFIYDSIKIMLLLFVMIWAIGFIRTYVPEKRIRKLVNGKNRILSHLAAALFGAVTPFCSCSSIPVFMSFIKARIPLGISFSFLVTSPIINEYLAVLMLGFFGWKITLAYVISGIVIGVVSGIVLGKMKLEKYIEKNMIKNKVQGRDENKYNSIGERASFGISEALDITKKLWVWILIGVGFGAVIHNYLPEEIIQAIIGTGGIFTVPLAVLVGVPLYAGCAAIVPVAVVLFNKGIPLGVVLAFMMATSALSLPEAIILRRAMKLRLIVIFFGVVALAIVFTGYLFNALQGLLV